MNKDFGYFEEDQLVTVRDLAIWLRLGRYLAPYWRGAVMAIILSIIIIATTLALPYLVRIAIDNYITNEALATEARHAGLLQLSLYFITLTISGFVANFFQVTILEWTGQHFMHDMRQHLFSKLLSQDLSFYNDNPSGKLVTRLTNDIQNMHEMFTSVIITLFNDLLQLAGILLILFWFNWPLAMIMSLFLPIIFLLSYYFSIMARDAFRKIRTGVAKINSFLQESISGINTLQICMRELDTDNNFRKLNQHYYLQTLYQIKIFGIFMPIIEVLATTSIATIIIYGGNQVLHQDMTIGVFTAFLFYMRLFFRPVRELSQKYSIVQSAMASAERIFQLLDRQPEIVSPENPVAPFEVAGLIQFKNVSFGYSKENTIIENLNLTISPGEMVALVGSTGSGKSTLINLLERLYEPEKGGVFLDQVNINELNINWLRNQIGLVLQDVIILPDTLKENITFGVDASDTAIQNAIEKSQLLNVVAQLPHGIDTVLGEGGFQLSAGQKQLLSLARILVRNSAIIVLDEATSNIDSSTEIFLEQALKHTMMGRTVIIIAHRLSTIKKVDRIIVLEQGRIIEQGNHEQLLRNNGRYREMLDSKP